MTSEYIERVLDTAQPDDWVLLQNEVNLRAGDHLPCA